MKTSKLLAVISSLSAVAFLAIAADAPAPAPAATVSVTLSDVHLCCTNCVNGVNAALKPLAGVSAVSDQSKKTVAITAPDKASAQKAIDALLAAGYFGTTTDTGMKINADTGAKNEKVASLEVTDVHLCCTKCVNGVKAALKDLPGYTDCNPVVKGATFTITGNFNAKDAMTALQKAGFDGKAGKTTAVAPAPKA